MSSIDLTPSSISLHPINKKFLSSLDVSKILVNTHSYYKPQGNSRLINQILKIENAPSHYRCIITNSSTEALFIALNALKIERLALKKPSFFGLLKQLNFLGIKITDFSDLHKDAIYIHSENSTFPGVLSLSQVNDIINYTKVPLIDDSPYGLLSFNSNTQRPSFESNSTIIRIGSFSKIIGPDFRLGYILLPEHLVSKFKSVKICLNLSSSNLIQEIISKCLDTEFINNQIEHYKKLWDKWEQVLKESNISYSIPTGGTLVRLNIPYSKAEPVFSKYHVKIENPKYSDDTSDSYIRLNFTSASPNKILPLLKTILNEI